MPTRNVVLTEQQAAMIERLVEGGRYQNASEVLREGLRLVEVRELEQQARLQALREAARVGTADIEEGRYSTYATRAAVESRLAAIAEDAARGGGASRRRKK